MQFHLDAWYAVARAVDIERAPLGRVIAGVGMVIFRKIDGSVVAIARSCPHRFAPLDRGTLIGDRIICKYHGLEFDGSGKCVKNPHTDRIDKKMHIAAYPAVERHGFVWVWPGDTANANPAWIPDLSCFDNSENDRSVHSYLDAPYRYDILVDNLMDLSHADYLHVGSFSAGAAEKTTISVNEVGHEVEVVRIQKNSTPPPFASMAADLVDIRTLIRWHPSQVIKFRIDITLPDQPFAESGGVEFYHIATPANDRQTHYFMGIKCMGPPDAGLDEVMRMTQINVIENEDGPMLQAIDEAMDGRELMAMHPLILPVDAGGLRVRRTMQRLMNKAG